VRDGPVEAQPVWVSRASPSSDCRTPICARTCSGRSRRDGHPAAGCRACFEFNSSSIGHVIVTSCVHVDERVIPRLWASVPTRFGSDLDSPTAMPP